MTNEFDDLYNAAEQEMTQRKNTEKTVQETKDAAYAKQISTSFEKFRKALLPKLDLRIKELYQSQDGKFIFDITQNLIQKIAIKEDIQTEPPIITHTFYTQKDDIPVLWRNDETVVQLGNRYLWETLEYEEGKRGNHFVDAMDPYRCHAAKLDKYQSSDLALKADINFGNLHENSIGFEYTLTENGLIELKSGFVESNKTLDIKRVGHKELINIFVQSVLNRSYYHPSIPDWIYRDNSGGGPF